MVEIPMVYDHDFVKEVLESDVPVAVYCYSHACPASLRPLVIAEAVAEKYADKVKFVKADVTGGSWISSHFVICRVPTLMIFSAGREVERITWTITEENLPRLLDKALAA